MAGVTKKPKKSKIKAAAVGGTDMDDQPVATPVLPAGKKRTIGSIAKGFLNFYLSVATIYFFWTLTILQFRECGLFGGPCEFDHQFLSDSIVLSIITAVVPKVALYSALIAFFRALLWLPNLIIETLRGSFLNWLLLRDVPPMQEFLSALAGILP